VTVVDNCSSGSRENVPEGVRFIKADLTEESTFREIDEFRKLSQRIVEEKLDIVWTTHMRFEETLLDEQVCEDAHASGCRYLHFGFESGNQRVLQLMDKATKLDAIETNLRISSEAGIWNHIM
jgi:radical SAM superfamily enzyme YgiQ (UPF0313 family)